MAETAMGVKAWKVFEIDFMACENQTLDAINPTFYFEIDKGVGSGNQDVLLLNFNEISTNFQRLFENKCLIEYFFKID